MSLLFIRLKRAIRRSGLSPYAIATRSSLSPQTIKNWLEDRVREPSVGSMLAVAKVLGLTVELVDGEPRLVEPIPDTPATVAAKMARAREFVGLWRRYQ